MPNLAKPSLLRSAAGFGATATRIIHKVDSGFKSIAPKETIARQEWLVRRGNCFLQDTLKKSVHGFVGTRCKLATLRREDALVDRAGFLNKTRPVEVTLRDKLNNFAHLLTKVGNSEKYSAHDSFSNSWFQVFRFGRPAPITSSFFWMAGPL